ncbi:duodenase-1-like isoform X2 [Kryptolebias marmoratus]|uniref:trypsin n=1 Tax=Kryptolebias marmoratus TaxID=37003 RepID=A0A3Q2ZR74_KRYMA|nr:duodenase-1-like isoform X2 [Kryptolebias marmoratus]
MFICCNLAVLMLVLTFAGQAHAGKIIGGHEAKPHSRPYMVLVERKTPEKPTEHCGGFLLNEDFVMTAAHCQAMSYNVFLGMHSYLDKQKQKLPVKQAFPHKNYHEENFKNDIMLLKLSSKAKFTNNVKPIDLADSTDDPLPKSCSVAGWGWTSKENNMMSPNLMEVNVTLIDKRCCAKKNVFCSKGKKGPGKGDSGGPLVCEGKAYGVVSANKYLTNGSMLYKYTKIADNQEWIDDIMKKF